MTGRLRKVKIGLLHSLTGTMAVSELPLLDAEQLAIDEINLSGGILGTLIEPVIKDGASDSVTFGGEAEDMLASGVSTIFGCWTSASRKVVKPLIEAADGLLWYPVQYEGLEESPNIVYTGSCLNQQITPAVEWIMNNVGPRIFLVGSDYVFPRAANLLIRSLVNERGGVIVDERYFPLIEREFRTVIDHIRQTQLSVVFNTLNGESNLSFYSQYHEAGIRAEEVPIMAVSAGETEMQPIADLVPGHLACWSYFQSFDYPENHRFVEKFKERYGASRVCSDPAVMAYSQIHLWKQAVERAGSFESAKVRSCLIGCETESPAGRITIQANHHLAKSACIGRIVAGGQFEVVWCTLKPIRPLPWLGLEDTKLPSQMLIKQCMSSFSDSLHYGTVLESELQEKRRLEDALQRSNEGLDALVEERTAELADAVQRLLLEIAERRQAEDEILRSKQFVESIVNSLPSLFYVFDSQGTFLRVNEKFLRVSAYSLEEVLNMHPRDFFSADEKKKVEDKIKEAFEKGESFIEADFTSKDGKRIPHYFTGYCSKIADTSVLVGVGIDITERKRTEKELRESEQHFRLLVEKSPYAIAINSERGDIEYLNERFIHTFGYTLSDTPTLEAWWKHAYPDEQYRRKVQATWESVAGTAQTGGKDIEPREYQVTCKDGRVRTVEIFGTTIGKQMIVILNDITARKQTEDALKSSEERFRTMFEKAPLGIGLIDSRNGSIYEVNQRYADIAGRTRAEMKTIDWMSITHPDDVQEDLHQMARLNSREITGFQMNKRYLRPDGSVVWISLSVTPLSEQNLPCKQHLAMIDDISERKHVEEDKRQFYRNTILSVTDGKLDLVSLDEVKDYLDAAVLTTSVASPVYAAVARHEIIDFCISRGLGAERLVLFENGIGEAITNAVKHANGCSVYAGVRGDSVFVAISDTGPGISTLTLPGATLRRGFSTKASLGMGYSIMIETCDQVLLCTGRQGTTVVLLLEVVASEPTLSLDGLKDTWDEIPDV